MIGAIAASAVCSGLFPGALAVRTTLRSELSVQRGVFIELFATLLLVFSMFVAERLVGASADVFKVLCSRPKSTVELF